MTHPAPPHADPRHHLHTAPGAARARIQTPAAHRDSTTPATGSTPGSRTR